MSGHTAPSTHPTPTPPQPEVSGNRTEIQEAPRREQGSVATARPDHLTCMSRRTPAAAWKRKGLRKQNRALRPQEPAPPACPRARLRWHGEKGQGGGGEWGTTEL
eukprot:scaffold3146_cov98-Isochrysis_galbana.AAC.2